MSDSNDIRPNTEGDGAATESADAGSLVHDVSVHSEEIRADVQQDRLNDKKGRDFVRLMGNGLLFILIPVLVMEFGIRVVAADKFKGQEKHVDFYHPTRMAASNDRQIDYLFVGSSRVAAAVEPQAFADVVEERTGTRPMAIDQGKGYSTLVEHYFHLRNLAADYPGSLQGTTVMIESPMGLAQTNTWDGEWAKESWPELLGPPMRVGDLPQYVLSSTDTKETKVAAIGSALFMSTRYWDALTNKFEGALNRAFGAGKGATETKDEDCAEADMSTDGGVRCDDEGIDITRKIVRFETRQAEELEEPVDDWNRTAAASIVELVRAEGGEVVFFDVPMGSYGIIRFGSEALLQSTEVFTEYRQANGLRYVRTAGFACNDDDFPDFAHLRHSRAEEYSRTLAESFLNGGDAGYPDGRIHVCDLDPTVVEEVGGAELPTNAADAYNQ
ncbi:MAG: hypothetical protein AAFQ53_01120 [Bacteroidota bacterium]